MTVRKKIAHVTFDMSVGGAERVIQKLVEHTDKSRFDVSVICLEQPVGAMGQQLQAQGYHIQSFSRKPGLHVSLLRALRRYVANERFDLLHCHQYTPYVYGVLAAAFSRTRVIFTEHGRFYPDQRKLKRVLLNPLLCRLTSHLTAISAATREALIEFENFPAHRINVIYNGIDPATNGTPVNASLRRALGIPAKAMVLGSVGRLDAIKNQAMMLRALKQVLPEYPDTWLLLVGEGPERQNLERLAWRLGITARVIFAGCQADPQPFYEIMDIFLLTSYSEGTAMTLLEAMANGLVCVVTNVGGNPEIIVDDCSGLIIPSDAEQILATKILRLFAERTRMAEMGEAARARFTNQFTATKMTRSYESWYATKERVN